MKEFAEIRPKIVYFTNAKTSPWRKASPPNCKTPPFVKRAANGRRAGGARHVRRAGLRQVSGQKLTVAGPAFLCIAH